MSYGEFLCWHIIGRFGNAAIVAIMEIHSGHAAQYDYSMEKVIRVFGSFEEADAADVEEDMRLTPEQRISILLELQARVYPDAAKQGLERVCRIIKRGEG